jgi:hypothetical protein
MQTQKLVPVESFCSNHNIEYSFINSLQQIGLIDVTIIEETNFIEAEQLQQLEKIVGFYYDLGINLEGIETIDYMLQRITSLQEEIVSLRNRIRLYELID